MDNKYGPPPALPRTTLKQITPNITLLEPLSRRGCGPGLVLLVSEGGSVDGTSATRIEHGVPAPLMKWAEESYTVVEITQQALFCETDALKLALTALAACQTTEPKDAVGIISTENPVIQRNIPPPILWNNVADKLALYPQIVGAIVYADTGLSQAGPLEPATVPQLHHLAGKLDGPSKRDKSLSVYNYPGVDSYLFATPFQSSFAYNAESVSHTRNLAFLKGLMHGPHFDLESIWDEHTYYEFENRSVECTMATMVQEPYVNHVPTLTGGVGRENLTAFYRDHFIFQNSEDTETELISRSVGIDRVIDEFIFKCTHKSRLDWLLPGIPATDRKLEIPFTAVVNIRGDRLYHEHIAWDQATVLMQIGLMPQSLPYPLPVPGRQSLASPSSRFEFRVPAAGVEAAAKLRDKDFCNSNEMFEYQIREISET